MIAPSHDDGELRLLLDALPGRLLKAVDPLPGAELLEIVLDLGRPPEARLVDRVVPLSPDPVGRGELDEVLSRVGPLGADNRAGIERTLHRVSAIRNRAGQVVGLTLRVGRAIYGTIDLLRDLVVSGKNILLLGRPGVGKTTKLREIARVLAEDVDRRVMVVDTSNEIGGDGDIPHPGIGRARRMQVAHPELQHAVMIEAVENHMPEAIIVDEIGTEAEALAARTIAERGVQLVATAHGNTLENLVLNPTLSDLVGGVHTVTLSDEEARRRGTLKTITERRAPPTFDVVVEMVGRDEVRVHRDTAAAVDALLAGGPLGAERRVQHGGRVESQQAEEPAHPPAAMRIVQPTRAASSEPVRVHAYGVGRDLVERVVRDLGVDVKVVSRPENAEILLVVKARMKDPRIRRLSESGERAVYQLKRASGTELKRVLRNALLVTAQPEDEASMREAVRETEHAIERVLNEQVEVALSPQPPRMRKMQRLLIARYHLDSVARGSGAERRLVVYPALPGQGEGRGEGRLDE